MLLNNETEGTARVSDLHSAIPSIVGKIEMVYEGEQEGAANVAHRLIAAAIRSLASTYFPDIEEIQNKKAETKSVYEVIKIWFEEGKELDLLMDQSDEEFKQELFKVNGLRNIVSNKNIDKKGEVLFMEYLLHSLAEYSVLDKSMLKKSFKFQDYFNSIMKGI